MLLAAFLFFAGAGLRAADELLEGRQVLGIEFEPAGQPLPRAELDRLIPFKAGDSYHAATVRDAIQKLYSTGRYTDIAVDAVPAAAGVTVRFITTANAFIGRVTATGSPEPPNAGQLVTATKLQLGTEFANNDIRQAEESILERLRANGLYQAKVSHSATRDADIDQINIDFRIDPGARAKFAGVEMTGDPSRTSEAIARSTRWRRPFGLFGWRPMSESRVQNGLENVRAYYQRHDRLLARVTLSGLKYDEKANAVTPSLTIDPGPLVRVTTSGVKVPKGKLRQMIPIYQERSVDRSLLIEGQRNLIDYFQAQGYFDASVDFNQSRNGKDEEVVEYEIDRNERHKLAAIAIAGNRYFTSDIIRERMYLAPASFPRFPRGRYSQRYLERDRSAIEDLYRSNGFRDVRVSPEVDDDYQGRHGSIAVKMNVEEGSQYLIDKLELEGVADKDRERLISILHSAAGQPFSEYNVASDRDAVLAYYFNAGYPNATFDWSQSPSADPHKVDVKFTIHPGDREFVRKVVVNGLRATNPALVNQRIDITAGDPLSQTRIADVQRRLYDLGIFAKVQTAVQNPDGREEGKYVLYQLEEARRYSVNVGFGAEVARIGGGVTTFDAPAGATGFSPRVSLGVSRLNFLGLGHTVSLQSRVSTLQKRVLLSYFAPQFQGSDRLNLTFTGLYDDSRDVRTFAARRVEGSIQLGQRFTRANTMQYRFVYRDVFVDPNSVKINEQLIPILSQSVRVAGISTTLITDRRDDPTDAHRGLYQTIDVGYASKAFGSQTGFVRMVVKNSTYHRLTRDLIFARTTNFGFIQRTGGLAEIPLPERYFSGGAYSNRAFPDNQAGPRDPITGFPLGGTAVLMNSFELRFPLLGDNLGGVLFHDAGNVYSSLGDISLRFRQRDVQDFNYMVHGVGFGIRYRTPLGPIRADISLSPNSPHFIGFQGSRDSLLTCSAPGSSTTCPSVPQRISLFQFHFSLGQAF
ncbi:MAG: BamA/TamA family outer membrane protein [Acidobacteria bacterium]|nr:BamA/TamA family outer membrane protein [Acidobacteriota bacterium]